MNQTSAAPELFGLVWLVYFLGQPGPLSHLISRLGPAHWFSPSLGLACFVDFAGFLSSFSKIKSSRPDHCETIYVKLVGWLWIYLGSSCFWVNIFNSESTFRVQKTLQPRLFHWLFGVNRNSMPSPARGPASSAWSLLSVFICTWYGCQPSVFPGTSRTDPSFPLPG